MQKRTKIWRFLEILPGTVSWLLLALPIIIVFINPLIVVIFIILFDLYWLYKALIMGYHLIYGHLLMKASSKVDWLEKCKNLETYDGVKWDEIYHVVMITTYDMPVEMLRLSYQSIANSNYPKDKIIAVLAIEERNPKHKEIVETLEKEFSDTFFKFLSYVHPDGIAGELKAKGANATWAAKRFKLFLEEKNIPFDRAIVTTADEDSRLHPQYLPCLTYKYLITKDRAHTHFQPIPFYSNNIWYAPPINRILAFGASFWQIIEATRPHRMVTFATHANSMQSLIEMDYWDITVVNEDSRQYWRAYFAFSGKEKVVPIFFPVYMDTVLSDNYYSTLVNQYKQRQRWAYGMEHFPYVVLESIKHKEIPFFDKWVKVYRMFEGGISWATASFFVSSVAWIPFFFGPDFSTSVAAQNLPYYARILLTCTWIGLLISAFLSMLYLPPKPKHFHKIKFFTMLFQWVFIPITAIIFGSIPALDSQTRLLRAKYMGFFVTPKPTVKIDG